jgi:hypothetical protein
VLRRKPKTMSDGENCAGGCDQRAVDCWFSMSVIMVAAVLEKVPDCS